MITSSTHDPMILYVLMRNDVPDFVVGKAIAQANHAGTQFVGNALLRARKDPTGFEKHFLEWYNEATGFGTCIILECSYMEMVARTATASGLGLTSGIITDPTYPIRDGHCFKTLSIETCSYVFGRKSRCQLALSGLNLFS